MKAGEREYRYMEAAMPRLVGNAPENWQAYEDAGALYDQKLRRAWYSEVPGSLAPCRLVNAAVQAMENRGYDVSEAEALLDAGFVALDRDDMVALNRITAEIYAALHAAPRDPFHDYWQFAQYSDFDDVKAEVRFPSFAYDRADFPRRIRGGWLGMLVGSAAGTQMEGYITPRIVEAYGEIKGYLRPPDPFNDDLMYSIAFLDAFSEKGAELTSEDIALRWAALVPEGYSAEEIALDNIRRGILPPRSGSERNFFSDWIGAQMRTAVIGMVSPGNPAQAAELAWRDSVVSHANNGALGGIFNALLASLAFVESDPRRLLERAIALLPARSQYYSVVAAALAECGRQRDWRMAWEALEARNRRYHWIHAYPNACAEVVALWYGEGNFDRTLNIVCQAGRDTDCNAGQVLAILGIIHPDIPAHWTEPLGDTVYTFLRAYREVPLEELIRVTVEAPADSQEPRVGL